jgi:phosphopantothenoylcysteine decarboxylase/phosphopantothenate--cysteine ligase
MQALRVVEILRKKGVNVFAHPSPTALRLVSAQGWEAATGNPCPPVGREDNAALDHAVDASRPEVQAEQILSRESKKDLQGCRVLITAGPTIEDIDSVRFISNRSTGKMGVALATVAARRGATVILVHGPLAECRIYNPGVESFAVRSAKDMYEAAIAYASDVDVAILSAAVCDFAPAQTEYRKIKKDGKQRLELRLKKNPDILETIGQMKERPFLVGFAAETENLRENARSKMDRKHCDMICANDVSEEDSGFGTETNRLLILAGSGEEMQCPRETKPNVAGRVLDEIAKRV